VVEGVLDHGDPPKYRYFVTKAEAERLQRLAEHGGVVRVDLIPVPDYQVEADPEGFAALVEIELKGE